MTVEANPLGVGARSSGPNKAVTKVVEWQRLLGARNHTSFLPRGTDAISNTIQTVS